MQKKNKLDGATIIKILKGAMIAGGAVVIIYILEAIPAIDLGAYSVLVAGVCSVLINAVREFRKGVKSE